jgi:hypothetical protein
LLTWARLESVNYTKGAIIQSKTELFTSIKPIEPRPIITGFDFIDKPLEGGIPLGGAIFLAGAPGSGKSTIATQIIGSATSQGKKVLYIAGEEHPGRQLARFKRLGVDPGDLLTFYTAKVYYIEEIIDFLKQNTFDLLIVDSMQKIRSSEVTGVQKTVTASVLKLYNYVQYENNNIAVLAISQNTKDGKPQGMNTILHEFDAVIQIEAISGESLRTFYYSKNRFGESGARYDAYLSSKGFIKPEEEKDAQAYPVTTILDVGSLKDPERVKKLLKQGMIALYNNRESFTPILRLILRLLLLPLALAWWVVKMLILIILAVCTGGLLNIIFYRSNKNSILKEATNTLNSL